MITLRDYQVESIRAVAEAYKRGVRRPAIGLPTGTGKTIIFASIIRGAVQKYNRALVLAHRDELITQAVEKICEVAPEMGAIGIVKARQNEYRYPITVASVQSLHTRRLEQIASEYEAVGARPFDLIIVDEAHHAAAESYVRILERLGCFGDNPPLTIGVSATLQRADGKDLGDVWEEVVYHRDILSMIMQGYLCNLRGISIKLAAFDADGLKVRRGDFVAEEASDALIDADAPVHTVRAWLANARDRKTIVFTPTIRLAEEMRDEFRARGVQAAMVSGETPLDERRALLSLFKTGDVQVVCNAQVLTEGFDEPTVDCIVIARPTRSQPMYVQMVGRGTRLSPGKTDCLVLDVVGASERNDLTTLPKLFGLGDEAGERVGGDEESEDVATIDVMAAAQSDQLRLVQEGRIVAKQVELFNRQDLAWRLARPGLWSLHLGDEQVVLRVGADNRWQADVYGRERTPNALAGGITLEMAMGVAEEYARRSGSFARRLMDKSAKWRTNPASEDQREALRRWRSIQAEDAALTAGEASDLLTQYITLANVRRGSR